MESIMALCINNREGLTLLESVAEMNDISLKIIPLTTFTDAETYLNLTRELPDLILISSGCILRQGEDKLLKLLQSERICGIKTIVLTEFKGEEEHLFNNRQIQADFIEMPDSLEGTADVLSRIYEMGRNRLRQIV